MIEDDALALGEMVGLAIIPIAIVMFFAPQVVPLELMVIVGIGVIIMVFLALYTTHTGE